MAIEKKMEDRRINVMRYDKWTCKLCDEFIQAPPRSLSDERKEQLLISHIKTRHKDSRDVDYEMKDRFLVLYFSPYTGDVVQKNEKLL